MTLFSPSSVFYLPTFIPDIPPSLPFAPTTPALVMPQMLGSAIFIFSTVRARVSRSHVGVHVCERVCLSQACQGNGPCVHRLRAVDTVPPCDCETRLWHVAGGRGGRRPGAGPFPTHGCRTTSVCTQTQLCPFRGQNLIFLLVQSSEPSRESLRISLSMKVPTMDGVSKQ